MRKICLAVGVGDAQQLAYLPGARNGAEAFGAWAKTFGYQTFVLTDEKDPVTVPNFKKNLENLLVNSIKNETERAIIYFAGHGMMRGGDDLWLLSTWFSSQEALSVNGLMRRLERYNIKRLIVISDACRTLPTGAQDADLTEHKLLPRGPMVEHTPQADHWRASSKYRAAFMVRGQNGNQDRCIFSGVLIDALWGYDPAAFESGNGVPPRITNFSLAQYLQRQVPQIASRYKVKGQAIELTPDLKPGLWPPDNVYVDSLPQNPPPITLWPPGGAVAQGGGDGGDPRPHGGTWSTREPYLGTEDARLARDETNQDGGDVGYIDVHGYAAAAEYSDDGDEFQPNKWDAGDGNESGDANLENDLRSWFDELIDYKAFASCDNVITIFKSSIGDDTVENFNIFSSNDAEYNCVDTSYNGVIGGRIYHYVPNKKLSHSVPILINLPDGIYAGASLYENSNTGFYITDRGVEGLSIISSEEIRERREYGDKYFFHGQIDVARALSMLQSGTLSPDEAPRLAEGLRYHKHGNPVAGVIAAYLYNRVGDIDNIRRIALFYIKAGELVPFDVALLARGSSERIDDQIFVNIPSVDVRRAYSPQEVLFTRNAMEGGRGLVAGAFPWLRQGWILLEDEGEGALYPPGLSRLTKHLLPAPFTTLRAEGGAILAQWLERGATGDVE